MENLQASKPVKQLTMVISLLRSRCVKAALSVLLSSTLMFSATVSADPIQSNNRSDQLDDLTAEALSAISTGKWPEALSTASELVSEFPDYALGHWLLAESHTILSMSYPLLDTVPRYSTSLIHLLLEAKTRAQHAVMPAASGSAENELIPDELVQVGTHIDNVVLVDLNSSVLYQFDTRNELPTLVKQHYISSGKAGFGKLIEGDNKSPLGIYSVYGFRSDESLPSLYGSGALMLNYPNALDRSMGRTGSGIWLHGNPPKERSRSPRSSQGCVTMANDHLIDLYHSIDNNRTHIVLTHNIQWRTHDSLDLQRQRFQELFEQYKAAWAHNRPSDLFSLYTNDALPEPVRHAHSAYTKEVSTPSTSQHVTLSPIGLEVAHLSQVQSSDVSMLRNPSINPSLHDRHLVMSFDVNSGAKQARVTLYWERHETSGYWQIKREVINAGGA